MKHITVYCSSAEKLDKSYHQLARGLGEELASQGFNLVYGGGSIGLMGTLARSLTTSGGEAIGVITETLQKREIGFEGCKELIVVKTMQERRRIMMDKGDAFIILPGGVGTLEEFFEVVVGKDVGEHDKPIALLDTNLFFNPLIDLFQHSINHKFVRASILKMIIKDSDPKTILKKIQKPSNVSPEELMPEINTVSELT